MLTLNHTQVPVAHIRKDEIINQLIFAALYKHLGDKCKLDYINKLKEDEELTKRTIDGCKVFELSGKVILVIKEVPAPTPDKMPSIKYKIF